MSKTIPFTLNGKKVSVETDAGRRLLWVLRSDLNLTGTKYGCGIGFCGTCTVLVEGDPVRSCQFPMEDAEGKNVTTIEGMAENGKLHPLQSAFMEHNALQCGYCTPGMILQAWSLLQKNPNPTREEIKTALEENLCRCGSHHRIIQAVEAVSKEMKS
jgi:carbon-monoxide dehydrogenase small subunit